jgi:hypothetical protein
MSVRRTIRNAVLAATLMTGTLLVATAGSAQAIPFPGQHEGYTYVYYSDASHTTVVGGWSYGSCGGGSDWGEHTSYYTITTVRC